MRRSDRNPGEIADVLIAALHAGGSNGIDMLDELSREELSAVALELARRIADADEGSAWAYRG